MAKGWIALVAVVGGCSFELPFKDGPTDPTTSPIGTTKPTGIGGGTVPDEPPDTVEPTQTVDADADSDVDADADADTDTDADTDPLTIGSANVAACEGLNALYTACVGTGTLVYCAAYDDPPFDTCDVTSYFDCVSASVTCTGGVFATDPSCAFPQCGGGSGAGGSGGSGTGGSGA